ncbi:hypothetical protein [uncultured Shewanella sp.]|uniref:hypothetical protein n=1 Tax=uncultured Shewanella sp. TaxID=173975 RepID=UPI0026065D38|nr:hypothetical protein [uncultured Shewanella sp.]
MFLINIMKKMNKLFIVTALIFSAQAIAKPVHQIAVDGKQYHLTKKDFVYRKAEGVVGGVSPIVYEYIANFDLNGDSGQKLYFNLGGTVAGKAGVEKDPVPKGASDASGEIHYLFGKNPPKQYQYFRSNVELSCSKIAIGKDSFNNKKYLSKAESNDTKKLHKNRKEKVVINQKKVTKGKCKQLQVKIKHVYNQHYQRTSLGQYPMSIDNIDLTLSVLAKS